MTQLYGWSYTSGTYHAIAAPRRGWHAHQGGERWVDVWAETAPADRVPCVCVDLKKARRTMSAAEEQRWLEARVAGMPVDLRYVRHWQKSAPLGERYGLVKAVG